MPLTFDEILRDYVTDGVSSSGAHKPRKSDLRDALNDLDRRAFAKTLTSPLIVIAGGASNMAGSDEADGGNTATDVRVKAFDYSAGAWVTATRGVAPLKAAVPPYAASNTWALQFCLLVAEQFDIDVYLIHYAKASTDHLAWTTVANGGTSGSTNRYDATQPTAGGTIPKLQTIVDDAFASAEIVATGKTAADVFLWDNGGIDTLIGVKACVERLKTFVDQVYAEDWMTATTPFIAAEMPWGGSYGDVTQAWNVLYRSGDYPWMGLLSTEFVPFTRDIYGALGDDAHYSGTGHDEMGARALDAFRKLPHGNLGSMRNILGGNGVLIDASAGAVAGESITNPYLADLSVDGAIYALTGTLGGSRQTTYVRCVNTNRARNLRSTFLNYLEHGFRLVVMAPLATPITLVSAVVSAGNVICTYTGDVDPSDGDTFWFSGITWAGSPIGDQLNNAYWDITSLDTVGKTFIPIVPGQAVKPVNTSWTNGTGGTIAAVIEMEDPRSGDTGAREVAIMAREAMTVETFGSSATAPLRVRDWNFQASDNPERDYRRRDNLVMDPQAKAGGSTYANVTRSIKWWQWGGRNSGPYYLDSCMTLTDTGGNTNDLYVKSVRVRPGDVVESTYMAKASSAPSTFRQVLQFFDSSGAQVGSDTDGTNDTSVRASWTRQDYAVAVAPASSVYCKLLIRGNMTTGTLSASDFVLRRLPTLDDPFAWVYLIQAADSAALTSTTSLQKLFDTAAAGAFTAEKGLYETEGYIRLTGLSSTSGDFGLGFLGTGAVTGPELEVIANKGSGLGSPQHTDLQALTGVTPVVSANTSTNAKARVRGILPVTTAGTLIPSIKLSQLATPVLKAKSWWRFRRIPANAAGGLVMTGWE